jgi:hypothetical protein
MVWGRQVEVHRILRWTAQLHRRWKARTAVARRLRLHDACQHLPHRHGSGFGRYRVEEDKFSEVPCTQTRIAFSQGGKCLQGYRLGVAAGGTTSQLGSSSPCDMGLDVVIDTVGKLAIEADILGFDPYKVYATGSLPRGCYVRSYTGYDQEHFQDMNQVTRRGTNWRNLQINDMQDQWHAGTG